MVNILRNSVIESRNYTLQFWDGFHSGKLTVFKYFDEICQTDKKKRGKMITFLICILADDAIIDETTDKAKYKHFF